MDKLFLNSLGKFESCQSWRSSVDFMLIFYGIDIAHASFQAAERRPRCRYRSAWSRSFSLSHPGPRTTHMTTPSTHATISVISTRPRLLHSDNTPNHILIPSKLLEIVAVSASLYLIFFVLLFLSFVAAWIVPKEGEIS